MIGSLLIALVAGVANASPDRSTVCGGMPTWFNVPLGTLVMPKHEKPHLAFIVAVSPVTTRTDPHTAVAWIGLDDFGNRWIRFRDGHGIVSRTIATDAAVVNPDPTEWRPWNSAMSLPPSYSAKSCDELPDTSR